MRRSHLGVLLSLLFVFLSGIVVGIFGDRLYSTSAVIAKAPAHPSPEEWRRHFLSEMQARLKLQPDQLRKLDAILDDTRKQFQEVRSKYEPEMNVIRERQANAVRAILSPEQLPEFEKYRAEREKLRRAEHR